MSTWQGEPDSTLAPIGFFGWALIAIRAPLLVVLIFGGLIVLLLLRLVERPVFHSARPVTPFITQIVCQMTLQIIGLRVARKGQPSKRTSAVVSNHSSWLDIFVLNAAQRVYFVSKAEVAGWPGISWLARATGTLFISRRARDAAAQRDIFLSRIKAKHQLLFFPEGTSTDGQRVLGFKSTLFAAFFELPTNDLSIQPVTVKYTAPASGSPVFYGWWGGMDFAPHMLRVIAQGRQGRVDVIYHAPVELSDQKDRKSLAKACEVAVMSGFDALKSQV